jgi:N-terminal domain of anti-restriction factor ArdC
MSKTTTNTRKPKLSRDEYLAQRSARVAELAARLEAWRDSDNPRKQDRYDGRFHHYSERNQDLILMQLGDDATVVRTFKGWLAEGRVVRKGEHGAQILAPAGNTTKPGAPTEQAPADAETTSDPDKIRRFFKLVTVFDISQTMPLATGAGVEDVDAA